MKLCFLKAKCNALHPVSERGDASLVQLLLQYNTNADVQNQVRKHSHSIPHLQPFPCCCSCNLCNNSGFVCSQHLEAPLHLAVRNSRIPVIHSLLAAGCNINLADKVGSSSVTKQT